MPYFRFACHDLDQIERAIQENIAFVVYADSIQQELLSRTSAVSQKFYLFNRVAAHIFRSLPEDELCLKFIRWMHDEHNETKGIPFAFSNDEFSILTVAPPIYFVPTTTQHGLLYLPLLLHEFGHLLYRLHDAEMQDLTNELQEEIRRLLEPAVDSDDLYATAEARKRGQIAERWFEWTKEFFCDAVGLRMGGPAFLHAVSKFTKWLGRDEFSLSEPKLRTSEHPITFLRIRMLERQAANLGYGKLGTDVMEDWQESLSALGVTEEYYGYFEPKFGDLLLKTIDDMLCETSPPEFRAEVKQVNEEWNSPAELLNLAWNQFFNNPEGFDRWEKQEVSRFLERY